MIDWGVELEKRYGKRKARDLIVLLMVINRCYRRDHRKVYAKGMGIQNLAVAAMMSRDYTKGLAEILRDELGMIED